MSFRKLLKTIELYWRKKMKVGIIGWFLFLINIMLISCYLVKSYEKNVLKLSFLKKIGCSHSIRFSSKLYSATGRKTVNFEATEENNHDNVHDDQTPVINFSHKDGYFQPLTKSNAFETAHKIYPNFPCIILVNPFLDQNVGSVARVMLNYGLTELRIVNPRCNVYSDQTAALSAGAFDIVKNATIFSSLSDCISDLTTVMATSDRTRGHSQVVITPEEAASRCLLYPQINNEKIGIMFGRESNGLNNEELLLADQLIKIPTFNHFSSLNLAQAVNVIGYEVFKLKSKMDESYPPNEWLEIKGKLDLATRENVDNFLSRTCSLLDDRLYEPNASMRENFYRQMRNIFQRTKMSQNEVKLMHGVISALVKGDQHQNKKNLTKSLDQPVQET